MKIQKKSVINLFYIPAVILFLVFVIYPFIQGIRLSFTNWNGYSQTMKF
ncbi:MAG TPA: glycerol-3-phosphate ABC transporter permease, partial [Lachnoclostridium sp.]|nr:glycerol-3-phosphate ABC transporter permease [Lachnoclostridium sp.]